MDKILYNIFFEARFDRATGDLLSFTAPGGPSLTRCCAYRFNDGSALFSDDPASPDAQRMKVEIVIVSDSAVESELSAPGLVLRRRFELVPGSPMLRIRYEIRATDRRTPLSDIGLPRLAFADGFNDVMEDEEDLYFDGEELGGGRELPCWRVFFRMGHRDGLLAATRSKAQMGHFQIESDRFDLRPHILTAYDTNYTLAASPLTFGERSEYVSEFEIGPWSAGIHQEILSVARLGEPISVGSPPPSGKPPCDLQGTVFHALDLAAPDATSAEFALDRWMVVDQPSCLGGKALMAGSSVHPTPLRLNPQLSGVHRIFVGAGNGVGIVARLDGDQELTYRLAQGDTLMSEATGTPFRLMLSGPQSAREVWLRTMEMDGKTLEIRRFPSANGRTVVNYVRFEKLTTEEERIWRERESHRPKIELSGWNDVPDIASFTDARNPDTGAYRANLHGHADAGVTKVFWRIDGQCSDYPSKVNTMRYVSARVHNVFNPEAKGYGRVLKKTDMLALATKAASDFGLQLYGWMRFNSYGGNVQSDFFKQHPEFHEEYENGYRARKLCLAFPEVRKHKVEILTEAAGYGLSGLALGFLRTNPMLDYAPILAEGYQREYGVLPPRDLKDKDSIRLRRLPETSPEWTRWWGYRARFLTMFGRELRAALRSRGLGSVKIAIWIRPNHCLLDGIDLPSWLDEGLCDEVVAGSPNGNLFRECPACYAVSPEWKRMVQTKARLILEIPYGDIETARKRVELAPAEGYDGVCTYESDYSVIKREYIELYHCLRGNL